MTQFVLVALDNKPEGHLSLIELNELNDSFLVKAADELFISTPLDKIYSLDIDGLFLDAQKSVPDVPFEKTELYESIKLISGSASEIIFWYGSEYGDLDCVYDEDELLVRLQRSISDSFCEAYVHFKKPV
ncbi:hypothetical protein CHH28_07900 [Bacterioplanes sanyensis]|uniref:Uncharacterized protein n=1 Tax=Bacterioplanes sanyensis TaxID=1249553 RepID=A0A222FK45_9GAMM|nr:hypothetical protein [Bacterioplanes sanyensis]ASP38603.1 hypothetical protein CHH28_07900 [Bacterioplanes sanyensis]